MTAKCGCSGFGSGVHRKVCGRDTDKELFVDIDIRPLPMCDECYLLCWVQGFITKRGSDVDPEGTMSA